MNGSTNVQVSAIATFASVLILWLARYFQPELMATTPEMFGELFTGFLIVVLGWLVPHDASVTKPLGTGSSPKSPAWLALLALAMLILGSCGIQHPRVDSVSDGIVVAAADIETAAQTTQQLCGNTQPGGECAPGATISTDAKNRLRDQLQTAQDQLLLADMALQADESVEASDRLARAEALLTMVQTILEERAR